LQVADVAVIRLDRTWRVRVAKGAENPVRFARGILPGTLTGRATNLTLDPRAPRGVN